MKRTKRLTHSVKVAPKPSPRLTRSDFDKYAPRREPDPENKITRINAQTACVRSENSRLEARIVTASSKGRQSVHTNERLKGLITKLDTRIAELRDEVKKRQKFVGELTEVVNEARESSESLQKAILSYPTYEKLLKELRQHQTKRAATAKRLKDARHAKRQTDFANPKEMLGIYKEDIATLQSNNVEIQKQIEALQKQVDVFFEASDLEKYENMMNGKDLEMKELMKRIRVAKRKDGKPVEEEDRDETVVRSFQESPIVQRVRFATTPNAESKKSTASVLDEMDREIALKTRTKQDLMTIAQQAKRSSHHKVTNVLSTAAMSDAQSFAELQKKIRECVKRLEYDQKEGTEEQLDKLKSEMTTVCATLESEEIAAYKEAKQHAEFEKQLRALDSKIEQKKNEIESTKKAGDVMQGEITEILKQRSGLRQEIDSRVEKKPPKSQKLVSDLTQYRVKYEDLIDRLRLAEAELSERKEKLKAVNVSEEKIDYDHLTQKKDELTAEVTTLRSEMKNVGTIVDTLQAEFEHKKLKKEKLRADLARYKRTIDIDEEEVDSLEKYSDRITDLLRDTKQKKK